jgi:hypothetical protein
MYVQRREMFEVPVKPIRNTLAYKGQKLWKFSPK